MCPFSPFNGTDEEGHPQVFTVRIPFIVPRNTPIGEKRAVQFAGALTYKLTFDGYYHALLVQGFPTRESAEDFLHCAGRRKGRRKGDRRAYRCLP